MANYEGVITKTGIAGSAILPYRFVVLAADGQMDHVGTTSTISPDGVSAGAQATVGDPFPYAVMNGATMKVTAGGAITKGGLVMSDANGKAIAFVDAVGNIACGRALQTSTADGQVIEVEIIQKKTGAGS